MKNLTAFLVFCVAVSGPVLAQINMKDKLYQKADQEIDAVLFGKKKNSGSDRSKGVNQDPEETLETYEPLVDDPLEGYERSLVNYDQLNTTEIVGFRDLINFLPNNFGNYIISQKPDGGTVTYGEYKYSSAEKVYSKGDQELRASILDYLQTGSFLTAYANQYEYESTEGILKSLEVGGQPGWFSSNYDSGETSVMVIVNNRFMIMITGEGLEESKLTGFMETLDIKDLPKGSVSE